MNLISKIAEMLGVEMGEQFTLGGYDGVYSFQELGLRRFDKMKKVWEPAETYILTDIIYGIEEIERQPFKPKEGEKYWAVFWCNDCKSITTFSMENEKNSSHYLRLYAGNCFRTEHEAELEKYNIYKKLTGEEWKE